MDSSDITTSTTSIDSTSPSSTSTPKRKITKCALKCGSAAVKSVGTCRYCSAQFCGKHRLPEAHACANLQSCNAQARIPSQNVSLVKDCRSKGGGCLKTPPDTL
ncbi:hypothetical protein BC829DRAFT_301240 [Chytridium lagenaria]|nr:hypothetical protein BC829DRAFT_301240 [Chytridium lagenaria]